MQRVRFLILLSAILLMCGCENTTFQSSVPAYPVRVSIDTRLGQFVHFQPTAFNSYITVSAAGYYLDGAYVLPVSAMDAWGYGGVVVFVTMNGYEAFDMACPDCASKGRKEPCTIDGIYALCPACGERYDICSGTAMPTRGIAHETLRNLHVITSDGKITVTQ